MAAAARRPAQNPDDGRDSGLRGYNKNTVDSAHPLHPGPAEELVQAGVKGETTPPRVDLGGADVEEQVQADVKGETTPPRVDLGGADVEEQERRRTLLGRAIPADLGFAESLIATDDAKFLEGQAVEVRSCLPSRPPEPFRARRYFPDLEIAVCQREEDEQTEEIISHLPVHPRDGGVDPAEQERRVAWIQKLTAEQIQQVDTLVHEKWQLQGTLVPPWMCGLFPADPHAAFWKAEYYMCMAELVEKLQQQQQVAGVCPGSGRGAGQTTSSQPEIGEGQAASGLRGETQPMLLQGRSPEA